MTAPDRSGPLFFYYPLALALAAQALGACAAPMTDTSALVITPAPPPATPRAATSAESGAATRVTKGTATPPPGDDASKGACAPAMVTSQRAGGAGLFSFEQGGLVGFRDARGAVVIPPRFAHASEFSTDGVAAAVESSGRAVFIDRRGATIAQAYFFDNGPDYFVEGRARVVERGLVGFLDRAGRVVVPPRYDYAAPFCRGRARVCVGCTPRPAGEHTIMAGGRWGEIDRDGNEIAPLVDDADGGVP